LFKGYVTKGNPAVDVIETEVAMTREKTQGKCFLRLHSTYKEAEKDSRFFFFRLLIFFKD